MVGVIVYLIQNLSQKLVVFMPWRTISRACHGQQCRTGPETSGQRGCIGPASNQRQTRLHCSHGVCCCIGATWVSLYWWRRKLYQYSQLNLPSCLQSYPPRKRPCYPNRVPDWYSSADSIGQDVSCLPWNGQARHSAVVLGLMALVITAVKMNPLFSGRIG